MFPVFDERFFDKRVSLVHCILLKFTPVNCSVEERFTWRTTKRLDLCIIVAHKTHMVPVKQLFNNVFVFVQTLSNEFTFEFATLCTIFVY